MCVRSEEEKLRVLSACHASSTGSRMAVQQQKDGFNCGLFSIAFAYHVAAGDNVKRLNFDQENHLVSCLSDQKFTPFPQHESAKKIIKCSHSLELHMSPT